MGCLARLLTEGRFAMKLNHAVQIIDEKSDELHRGIVRRRDELQKLRAKVVQLEAELELEVRKYDSMRDALGVVINAKNKGD